MSHEKKPWSIEDWERLAAGEESNIDLVVHAALDRALRGDVDSLTSMLQFCASPEGQFLQQPEFLQAPSAFTMRFRDGRSSRIDRYEISSLTLMQAVAIGLSFNGSDRLSSPLRTRLHDAIAHELGSTKERWAEDDDRLLRLAIDTWRADDDVIGQLFVACARFISHPAFVSVFADESVNMKGLMGHCQRGSLHDSDDKMARGKALPMMLASGNAAGVAQWLGSVKQEQWRAGAQHSADTLFRGMARLDPQSRDGGFEWGKEISLLVRHQLAFEVIQRREKKLEGSPGPVARGLAQLIDVLESVVDEPQNGRLTHSVVTNHLDSLDDMAVPVDEGVVEFLMQQAKPGLEDGSLPRSLRKLALCAAAKHCPGVLRSLMPVLGDDVDHLHAHLIKSVAMAGKDWYAQRSGRLVAENLRQCLQLLGEAGVDLRGEFMDSMREKPCASTLLHALAESRHRDTCEALVVALEIGCDPTRRNGRNRTPAGCVTDADTKQRWMSVESSFLARQSAMEAVQESLGVKP